MNEEDGPELSGLSDHDLLLGGLWNQLAENRHAARRLQRMAEFCARREADYQARRADEPHFTLTPRQETIVEISELWGMTPGYIGSQLNMVRTLIQHFPGVWQMCRTGALDTYRASIIADSARYAVNHPEEFWRLSERLTGWLESAMVTADGRPPLVNRTVKQLRNRVNYELNRIKTDADARFRRAFADRSVRTSDNEDGTGSLIVGNSIDQVQVADHRLTLAAKALRKQGDPRTIDQLRADLAIDLIVGRVNIDATTGELEAAADGVPCPDGLVRRVPTPNFARPIVNVTVPMQTLMGIADEPGTLSGGATVPASLARMIAQSPDATWYRMLTDPAARCAELSTKSYEPTAPIWRQVVAEFGSCFRRNCSTPATEAELDHRIPWPEGQTMTSNLEPGCGRDHKAKHAPGFAIEQRPDGSLMLTTAAGFHHTTEPAQHPASTHWPELPETQFTATELLDALAHIRDQNERDIPAREELWEELNSLARPA